MALHNAHNRYGYGHPSLLNLLTLLEDVGTSVDVWECVDGGGRW